MSQTDNYSSYPYPSRRNLVFARNGMVATGQPLAAQAGLSILMQGGNAIDAAIATAACLTVVEPTANGIGGDAFALIWYKGKLYGLNASGPAPDSISINRIKTMGHTVIPMHGFIPVTVPGAPAAWNACAKRFGRLPLTKLLQPAIKYAEDGFPLAPELGQGWQRAATLYRSKLHGEEFSEWFRVFTPQGEIPRTGEVWRSPDHAQTLRIIAETSAESFYRGELAEAIESYAKKYHGFISSHDLANFQPEWVEPIQVNYRGYDIWEIPPNGQGLIALQALKILEGFDLAGSKGEESAHLQIEAIKLAFSDGNKYISDARKMKVTAQDLLESNYLEKRRKQITHHASIPSASQLSGGGTVYLATADSEGNMVSFIQSNYMGFGSGLVVPGTGIALHNRGHNFSIEPEHINALEPGKKPYHTIIPGFITRGHHAVGPFGVMGGFMQPQGHVQLLSGLIDQKLNSQSALDAPRWQWMEGKTIAVENDYPDKLAASLRERGHQIIKNHPGAFFGRGQVIQRSNEGTLCGATEKRTDGTVAAW